MAAEVKVKDKVLPIAVYDLVGVPDGSQIIGSLFRDFLTYNSSKEYYIARFKITGGVVTQGEHSWKKFDEEIEVQCLVTGLENSIAGTYLLRLVIMDVDHMRILQDERHRFSAIARFNRSGEGELFVYPRLPRFYENYLPDDK